MFRNRRRAASNSASHAAPPSSSASLAATKAFLRDRDSNGSLSSAAAAAALRTHTPTPTPVGETVTKRMMRKGSLSSQGSGSQRPSDLRRHSSSGSMTERSFRAPSPARSSPIDDDAPPVPAVPKKVPNTGLAHQRSSSLEHQSRGGSPVGRGGGRGVSLDRGIAATPGRGQQRTSRLANVVEDETEAGARSSVNFSRPMSPQQSPSPAVAASTRKGQSGWFGGPVVNPDAAFRGTNNRPKTSDGISSLQTQRTQQAVQTAANRPVSTKKTQLAHGVEGARLSSGSMRAKPGGAAVQLRQQQAPKTTYQPPRTVDPNSPYAVYDPSSRTFIHKGDAIALHKAMSEEDISTDTQYLPQRTSAQPQYQAPQQRKSEPSRNVHQWAATPPQKQEPQFDEDEEYEDEAPSTGTQPEHSEDTSTMRAPKHAAVETQLSEDIASEDARPAAETTANPKLLSIAEPDSQSPKFAPNLDSPYPRLQPPAQNSNSPRGRGDRNPSLSPPRNAHFAPVAVEMDGVKHQPLPRSVSPAKSALKASPSPSRRSYSPGSDEGLRKKKKNVRVSFDEAPIIAGTSAYADTVETPPVSGLAASRWSNASEEDDMDEYSIKPRPVLPSFGSVRDSNRRSRDEEAAEKVTETVSSSLSASATSASEPMESSSDHNIGGILAQVLAAKEQQSPLPPEVTTVEGTGYASGDSDESDTYSEPASLSTKPHEIDEPVRSTPEPEPKTLTNPVESIVIPESHEVPFIAVQPATPIAVESHDESVTNPEPKIKRPSVPGGWDDDESDVEEDKAAPPVSSPAGPSIRFEVPPPREMDVESTDNDSIYSDAYEDLSDSEEGFGSINAIVQRPISEPSSGLAASKHATNAVEEEMPQDESPVSAKSRPKAQSTESWDATQQHWSEINRARKEAIPKTKEEAAPVSTPASVAKTDKKETPVKATQTQERHIRMGSVEEVPEKAKAVKPAASAGQPRKSALKKSTNSPQATGSSELQLRESMRYNSTPGSTPSSEPRMRKSMRDGASPANTPSDPHLRKTMRGSGQSGLAASRYSAPSTTNPKPPKGTLQKKHIPATTAGGSAPRQRPQSASATIAPKSMESVPTYDSDSDASASSFQRQRPRTARKEGGRYTMRGSMRSGPAPQMRPAPTMRPTSLPVAASPPPTMRRSMRPSSPTAESPAGNGVRSSRFSIRSLSPAGRFRPKVNMDTAPPLPTQVQTPSPRTALPKFGKKDKTPPGEAPKSRFKSRFVDSSDEEDSTPRRFQSRFADSDSDDDFELPPDLTPVRGIPRKAGDEDGDSTDLEDELSDTEALPTGTKDMEKGKSATTTGVTNGQGSHVATGSLRDSKYAPKELPTMEAGKKAKAKRGFFGLGKKKAPASYLAEAEADSHNGSSDIPMPPERRNRDPNRPLTPIGEDKDVVAPASRSPKLQRRPNTPTWGRSASDSWPLPQPPKIGQDERPMSADGPARRASLRPTLLKRHSSQYSAAPIDTPDSKTGKDVIVGRSGKKKKFQGLRRVFGLHD